MSNNTEKGLAVLQGGAKGLPGFMNKVDARAMNREAAKGAGGGESPNRISIKASRFRLIVGGEQVKVFEEPYLDVVMLRANPEASKMFFEGEYDPNAEDKMPRCWSDNGIHPSPNVDNPVNRWCKNCPKNAWGSAISKISGKKIKACDDRKRVAIVPASNVASDAYQLSIPGASLGEFAKYLRMLDNVSPAVPYNGVVTRLSFDTEADYPRLQFEPQRYLTDEEYEEVSQRFDTDETNKAATITPVTDPEPENLKPAPEMGADGGAQQAQQQQEPPAQQGPTPEELEEQRKAAEEAKAKEQAVNDWGNAAATPEPEPEAKQTTKAKEPEEPPTKQHTQAEAKVAESGSAVDQVFEGWDD